HRGCVGSNTVSTNRSWDERPPSRGGPGFRPPGLGWKTWLLAGPPGESQKSRKLVTESVETYLLHGPQTMASPTLLHCLHPPTHPSFLHSGAYGLARHRVCTSPPC